MGQVDLLSLFAVETVMVMIVTSALFIFYYFLRPVKRSQLNDSALPFVSVIVPARNEETKVGRCLKSLVEQDYPKYEVIAIDDLSTDRTGQIIHSLAVQYPLITAVSGTVNPDGWIGKCNALVQAVGYAGGEWFLFTDADTCHRPNSLRDAVGFAIQHKADLVSFKPLQELGSFWEKAIMPSLLGSFFLGEGLHLLKWLSPSLACAYGQYILARRSSYHAVGGHQGVRDEIVEDHALARVFKNSGHKVMLTDGRSLYQVRMYVSLETLWHGWIKNLYSFADCNPLFLVALLVALNCVLIGPFVESAAALTLAIYAQFNNFTLMLLALATVQLAQLYAASCLTAKHLEGWRWYHFFLFPLGSVMISLLYLTSAFKVMSGSQINWKGRTYRVTRARTIDKAASSQVPEPLFKRVAAGISHDRM